MSRTMSSLACVATVLLAAFASASGSRELLADTNVAVAGAPSVGSSRGDLGSAPAPGPGAGMPPADLLFTLTAKGATLAADKLTLTNVADVALFSSDTSQTGVYSTAAFTNTTAGSEFVARNGRWLSDPVVVMRANGSSALLQLASPVYDAAAKTVTFKSKILPTDASTQLPTAYGVTSRYMEDAANGASAGALTAPPSGQLTDVALFIDEFSQNLGNAASTKQVYIGIGGGGWGWGRGWGGGGWGWNRGWGGGWGGWRGGWGRGWGRGWNNWG